MKAVLLSLFVAMGGFQAFTWACDALCWLDPSVGVCRW